jgi:hypothetical protein
MKALTPRQVREINSKVLDYTSIITRGRHIPLYGVGEKPLCAYPGCRRPKMFYIGWDLEDQPGLIQWGRVCATHDKQIGRNNLHKAYPFLNKDAIVHLDVALAAAAKGGLTERQTRALLKAKRLTKCLTDGPSERPA